MANWFVDKEHGRDKMKRRVDCTAVWDAIGQRRRAYCSMNARQAALTLRLIICEILISFRVVCIMIL